MNHRPLLEASKTLQIDDRSKKRAHFAPPWVMVDSVGEDNLSVEYFLHHFDFLITKFWLQRCVQLDGDQITVI